MTAEAESKVRVALKMDPALLKDLDAFVDSLPWQPTRTGVIETAIRELLERHQKAQAKRK
jgi:metal-responsive CopG/Arc/MetJ family transcriptional regulator